MGIQRNGGTDKVICFLGDMGSMTGIFLESLEYSVNFQLPILFVIEDNNRSVVTPTRKTWGTPTLIWEKLIQDPKYSKHLIGYYYESKYPHAGAGSRIQF
jgi:deoxyxylulose-5-phosphate synthase